jgi:GT2 family glycosyltransferase
MFPLVDVVVLNYNNKGMIEKCVESINKFLPSGNLIVIDQASTDGSRDWLMNNYKMIENKNLILNLNNNGAWAGRSQGVRASQTDYIIFLDSDTEARNHESEWLPIMLDMMREKDSGIIEMRVQLWDGNWRLGGFAACMVKREVFQDIGLFDSKFLIGADNQFWAKYMWNGKWKYKYCKETDIYHYCGGTITRGCLKNKAQELHQKYRIEMLEYIYTKEFLRDTQWKYNSLRHYHEIQEGYREN